MKFSENWLRQHVPISLNGEALAARLTSIGLEVTEMQTIGADLKRVVVARILSVAPHPHAERLQVCQVDAGSHGHKQIVCGAANVRQGMVVPLALEGACIGERHITRVELRSIVSEGMLCSGDELHLNQSASGLLELSSAAPIGEDLALYLALPDTCFDISLTPNRGDCLSIRGLAYDLAAACQTTVQPLTVKRIPTRSACVLPVILDAGDAVPVYVGRVIEGVSPTIKTPDWIAQRLLRSGIRPINLSIDITQYVMLELGQPMHVYDFDRLKGPITVRFARQQESLVVLDERTVHLDEKMLVIADADGPIALAGLIGGYATSVSETTQTIFLEAAHFVPDALLGLGRRLGYQTEASLRFERGVDPQLAATAIDYATQLMVELTDGRAGPRTRVGAVAEGHTFVSPTIHLRNQSLQRILGTDIPDQQVTQTLQSLGMQVQSTSTGWLVNSPSRRFDIALEVDLIEEVARIYGYDRIPAADVKDALSSPLPTPSGPDVCALRRHCQSRDYQETIQFSFLDAQSLQRWSLLADAVPIANPLSAEIAVMRPSLLPGLVACLAKNRARQVERVRLFEIGVVFQAVDLENAPPRETRHLAGVACGSAHEEQWAQASRPVDFYDLKGDVESLAALLAIGMQFRPATCPWLHPGRSAHIVVDDQCIGWMGQIHPQITHQSEINCEVYAFEFALNAIKPAELAQPKAVSRFPSVRRDLALLLPTAVAWTDVDMVVRQAAGPTLVQVVVFDRYVGKGIAPGFKSIAIGLIFQDRTCTLIDQHVDTAVAAVISAIEHTFAGRVRC